VRPAAAAPQHGAQQQAANAGNVMLPKHFKVRWAILQTCHFSESFAAKFTNQLIFDLFSRGWTFCDCETMEASVSIIY